MTPRTRRRIDTLVHDTYYRYAPRTIMPPCSVWRAPGHHTDLRSTI